MADHGADASDTEHLALHTVLEAIVMSSIVSQSLVVVLCTALLGAFAGYLLARHSSPGRLRRLLLSLLGSIVGGLISSISSHVMATFRFPSMLVDWLCQVLGA
jgi:uncharacterized membrane protein YeaQ/YmgE (transglycosylase-associated protein family)